MPIRHDGNRVKPASFEGNPTYKGIISILELRKIQT